MITNQLYKHLVKYDHDISNKQKLTTLIYIYIYIYIYIFIFITDIATPERNTTAIRKTTAGTYLLYLLIIALIFIYK